MLKRIILEVQKIPSTNNISTVIRHSHQSPSSGWRITSISPLPPEEIGNKIYDILLEAPDLQFLEDNQYSKESYDSYKLIHEDLLKKLLLQ